MNNNYKEEAADQIESTTEFENIFNNITSVSTTTDELITLIMNQVDKIYPFELEKSCAKESGIKDRNDFVFIMNQRIQELEKSNGRLALLYNHLNNIIK